MWGFPVFLMSSCRGIATVTLPQQAGAVSSRARASRRQCPAAATECDRTPSRRRIVRVRTTGVIVAGSSSGTTGGRRMEAAGSALRHTMGHETLDPSLVGWQRMHRTTARGAMSEPSDDCDFCGHVLFIPRVGGLQRRCEHAGCSSASLSPRTPISSAATTTPPTSESSPARLSEEG
jgi:hypothetical protein